MMRHKIQYVAPACLVSGLAAVLLGQFQMNTQVSNPGAGGSVRYGGAYQQNLLPSEIRNANWKSGALPSEIKMNANAVGPLAKGGNSAYIVPSNAPGKSYAKTPGYSMGSVYNTPRQMPAGAINPALTNTQPMKR